MHDIGFIGKFLFENIIEIENIGAFSSSKTHIQLFIQNTKG